MAQKVTLMTMHAAKGLEFPVVFIAGCENGLIPYTRLKDDVSDLDEERRLFYVAMTRAKEHLCLSWVKKRKIFGETVARQLSPFLNDIDKQLLKQHKSFAGHQKEKPQTQLTLF